MAWTPLLTVMARPVAITEVHRAPRGTLPWEPPPGGPVYLGCLMFTYLTESPLREHVLYIMSRV